MTPRNAKPTAGTVGDVTDSGELETSGVYNPDATVRLTATGYRVAGRPGIAAYLEEPRLSLDAEGESLRRTLYLRAHRSDEAGERADRALLELCGRFVPGEVYRFGRAAGLTAAGIVYGRTPEDRLGRAGLLAEITSEAQTIEVELKGAI